MSSLRNILQRCERSFILASTPLLLHRFCNFNPVYSDLASISRQAYSSDANESSENLSQSAQKSLFGQMDRALNSLPHCIDGKETKNVRPGILGRNQLTLNVLDLSPKTTTVSQKAFYGIRTDRDMIFEIDEVPEDVTKEELIAFYSKYGPVKECRLHYVKTGEYHAYVIFEGRNVEFNRAAEDRPHIIGGKPLRLVNFGEAPHIVGHLMVGYSSEVSLLVGSLPENVTEETLREEFSKYGKLVFWKVANDGSLNQSGPYGILTYDTYEESLNALNSGPHTIEGAVVDVSIAKEGAKSIPKYMFNKLKYRSKKFDD